VPAHLLEVLAVLTRAVRESPTVDARSGVSARFAIAGAETVAAAALRRATLLGETHPPVARACDTEAITATLRGKVEFEADGEGRELEILDHLLRTSIAQVWRRRLGGADLTDLVAVAADNGILAGDGMRCEELLGQFERVPALATLLERLELADPPTPARAASALEFALEGLYLTRRLAKDVMHDGRVVYGGSDGRGDA
jgi:magnesium chelatase subunit I